MNAPLRRSIVLAATLVLASEAAMGTDWRVGGFFSQRLEATGLGATGGDDDEDDEVGFEGVTSLGVSITAQGRSSTLVLAPGLTYAISDDDENSEFERLNPRFNASYALSGVRLNVNANFSVVPEFTRANDFDDAVLLEQDVLQINTRAGLGGSYALTRLTTANANVFAQRRTLDRDVEGISETQSFGVGAGLSRGLDRRTTASLNTTARHFDDLDTDEESQTFSVTAGLSRSLSPRLQLGANAGGTFARDEEDDDLSFIGGLNLSYDAGDTVLFIGLRQSVEQNVDGDLEDRTTLSLSAGSPIPVNSRFSVGLDAGLSAGTTVLDGDQEDRRLLTVAPSLNYALTRDWAVSGGYRFLAEEIDGDLRAESSVFLQISRGLTLLP